MNGDSKIDDGLALNSSSCGNLGKSLSRELETVRQKQQESILESFKLNEIIHARESSASRLRKKSDESLDFETIVTKKADALFTAAREYFKNNDFIQCIKTVNRAIYLTPDVVEFHILKAEAFIRQCDYSSAILLYRLACSLEPDKSDHKERLALLYYMRGQVLFDEEMFLDSLEAFTKAAELKPDNLSFHVRSILCLVALEKHDEALAFLTRKIEDHRRNVELLILRARLNKRLNNPTQSYFDAKSVLEIDAENTEATEMLRLSKAKGEELKRKAIGYDLSNRFNAAISSVTAAIRVDPEVAEYHVIRATTERKRKNFESAIDDLVVAMDKSNDSSDQATRNEAQRQLVLTLNDFAVECYKKGFYEDAVALLNKAIAHQKTEKNMYINRGDCFWKLNEYHFALSDYQQALELDPRDVAIDNRIAVIYNELALEEYNHRGYLQAEELFSVALRHNPRLPDCYLARARARYMLQDLESAKVDLLSSCYLGINEKLTLSLFARLFPNQSPSEVQESQFGCLVHISLMEVMKDKDEIHLKSVSNDLRDITKNDYISSSTSKELVPFGNDGQNNEIKVACLARCLEGENFKADNSTRRNDISSRTLSIDMKTSQAAILSFKR